MKYKLIAADFDDTIAHDDLSVSERLKTAVAKYQAKGGKFIIATGRMKEGILPACKELNLNGEFVCYQGAMIADAESGNVVNKILIDNITSVKILKYLESKKKLVHIYEEGRFLIEKSNAYSVAYSKLVGVNFYENKEPLSNYVSKTGEGLIKILVMDEPEKIKEFMTELKEVFPEVFITTSKKWIIEIISPQANKGVGVKWIADKYGIDQKEVICIGDSLNDYKMLEYAGLGVAVKNASKELKQYADLIAPSNDEDGVAYIVETEGMKD